MIQKIKDADALKYSFIVPVYGTERYLSRCVDSILAQQETDFEVLLVDDCSPDGAPALCDGLARRDGRIRVIHKEKNEGLGFARNTGLAAAAGDYVIFVDSDDTVSENLLSVCGQRLTGGTDLLVFGVLCEYEDKSENVAWTEALSPTGLSTAKGDPLASVFIALNEARVFPFAWNKVYRRAFLEEKALLFESTELIEDFLFNIAVFSASPAVETLPDPLYHYRRHAFETLVSRYSPAFFELAKRKYGLERDFLLRENALDEPNASFIAYSHIKHLISAAVRNRCEKADLSLGRQKELAKAMLRDPVTKQALAEFRPAGAKQKLIASEMQKENAAFVLTLAAGADLSQQKAVGLFKKYIRK